MCAMVVLANGRASERERESMCVCEEDKAHWE